MVLFFAPGIFAFNRGRVLRNIALWLAIFLGLALVYRNFGPDSPHPLFQLPDSMTGMHETIRPLPVGPETGDKKGDDSGESGFTPPSE
jgi:hypothetical protein